MRRPFPQPAANGLTDVIALAAGSYHTLAVRRGGAENGTVWGWGRNYSGSLGPVGINAVPKPLPERLNTLTNIRRVAAGYVNSYAIHANGTLYAWGSGGGGALGNGRTSDSGVPVTVSLSDVVDVDGGYFGALALDRHGHVFTWGLNGSGQLGDGSKDSPATPLPHPIPQQVAGLGNIVDIDANFNSRLALRSDGAVFAWGSSGTGAGSGGDLLVPTRVIGLPRVVDIAAGSPHIALGTDGSVWTW
jgi:alpha-tubulin suppressor-like RCC1 family protein